MNAPACPAASDANELFELVYGQLRQAAQQKMAEERAEHTLSATALVHEAYSAWTGGGFSCPTDLSNDGTTNATDRSVIVGAWTGGANCAP